jgi:4-hydroxybenzoate polyprenyltransferase
MTGSDAHWTARWWQYQRERFPLLAHGPLIAAFSGCAVSFSACLNGSRAPGWPVYAVAFGVCLIFFLQLRIADEFKDQEDDARWRPYRPVPRGLVRLGELRVLFIAGAVIQAGLAWTLDARLLLVLGAGWAYLSLMSVEFFARDWLKARPVVYLLTHMGIMPLVDWFATACDWLPRRGAMPDGLALFLGASFLNGLVIEIGRKVRQPADEETGVETYSKLWGVRGAAMGWMCCIVLTGICAVAAAKRIDFAVPLAAALGVAGAACLVGAWRVVTIGARGAVIEKLSGLWTLALYLMLGVVPLLLRKA